ncbi:MAG: hypothetical protein LBJ82_05040 [Deltaproteobacteria bacterium]|nr:hypothetical protein [Deltaproteobacteria bacterium]
MGIKISLSFSSLRRKPALFFSSGTQGRRSGRASRLLLLPAVWLLLGSGAAQGGDFSTPWPSPGVLEENGDPERTFQPFTRDEQTGDLLMRTMPLPRIAEEAPLLEDDLILLRPEIMLRPSGFKRPFPQRGPHTPGFFSPRAGPGIFHRPPAAGFSPVRAGARPILRPGGQAPSGTAP